VPETYIATKKEDLVTFLGRHKKIITKGIKNNGFNLTPSHSISSLTMIVSKSDLNEISDCFAPSLFQEYLDKIFELRIFYFNKKFYSAAIFSQNDEKTKVDFRNYNDKKPNRVVPYNLPFQVEESLHNFVKKCNLTSGSIDMIVSKEMQYYFLEINPVGQFDWISKACNQYLEKDIALFFYERNHKKNN
jgi:glutathione synthase/RimK-type ligase-like ATP-grasp enzyme